MKKFGIIVAAASLAVMVGGAASAYDRDNRGPSRGHGGHDRGVTKQEVMRDFLVAFDRMDRNNDNKIGQGELKRGNDYRRDNRGRPVHNQNWRNRNGADDLINHRNFNRFDLNHNGKLTRKELRTGVQRAFRSADRNRNGYLDQRELEQARWYEDGNDHRDQRNNHNRRDRRR